MFFVLQAELYILQGRIDNKVISDRHEKLIKKHRTFVLFCSIKCLYPTSLQVRIRFIGMNHNQYKVYAATNSNTTIMMCNIDTSIPIDCFIGYKII